jgi:hypothetical protein
MNVQKAKRISKSSLIIDQRAQFHNKTSNSPIEDEISSTNQTHAYSNTKQKHIPVSCLPANRISVTRPSAPPHVMPVALQHQAEGVGGTTQLSDEPQPEAANAAQSDSVPLLTRTGTGTR